MNNNPYEAPSAAAAATAATNAVYSSKALADEIRQDDAAMAVELRALAPRSRIGTQSSGAAGSQPVSGGGGGGGAVGDPRNATTGLLSSAAGGAGKSTSGKRPVGAADSTQEGTTLQFKESTTTEAYIDKTREIGLVRMSLAAKKAEIRKLDEDVDRAEKRLRQKREQLESTREKFNSFLKYSNLEQDAAVRRADTETKARQEKIVEIKKLSARMNRVELDIRKARLQVESCRAYKQFFDNLAKPRWFYDVLSELRVADRTEEILLETEETFERRSAELQRAHEDAVAERATAATAGAGSTVKSGGYAGPSGARPNTLRADKTHCEGEDAPLPELVPLEVQTGELERVLAAEAQRRVDEEAARIREAVDAMTLEDVKGALESQYAPDRIPMYFNNVDELLEVFINVEEGNLFLIQNCQELEEELEAVAMAHLTEKMDTQTMTNQRQAQMQVLTEKIAAAQAKLGQLEDRTRGLEYHAPKTAAGSSGGSKAAGASAARSSSDGRGEFAAPVTPEMYRERVEKAITDMFRSLNAGEMLVKQLTSQLQRQKQREAELEAGEQQQQQQQQPEDDEDNDKGKGNEPDNNTSASLVRAGTNKSNTGSRSGTRAVKMNTAQQKPRAEGKKSTKSSTGAGKAKDAGAAGGAASTGAANASGNNGGGNDAGANMGAVELLTIIENKIQEYQRYITDSANGVDEALILAVMKNSDKERRRQARLEHMAQQALEHEERSRKALERSQAPVVRRVGKPVLRRSHLPKDGDGTAGGAGATRGGRGRPSASGNGSRADDDGAEFFV